MRCSIKQSYNRYILIHRKVLIGEISASFVKLTAMKYAKNTFVLFGINNINKTCLYTESYICIGYTQANKQYIWVKRRTCCASKRRGPWASCYKTAWHLQWISHKSHYRIYTNLHQTFIKYLWTLERLVKTIRETLHDGSVYMTIWLTIKERLNYCGCKKKNSHLQKSTPVLIF